MAAASRLRFRALVSAVLLALFASQAPLPAFAQSAELRSIQKTLNERGYDAGPEDGFPGPRTRRALRAFQADAGLAESGEPDQVTRDRLFEQAAEEAPDPALEGGESDTGDRSRRGRGPVAHTEEKSSEPAIVSVPEGDHSSSSDDTTADDRGGRGRGPAAAVISGGARPDAAATPATDDGALTASEIGDAVGDVDKSESDTAALLVALAILCAVAWGVYRILRFVVSRLGRLFSARHSEPSPAASRAPAGASRARGVKEEPPITASAARPPPVVEPVARPPSPIVTPPSPETPRSQGWTPADGDALVAGRRIGGLVYVGEGRGGPRYGDPAAGYIDPALPVARHGGDLVGDGLPYWPNYAKIDASSRATYLDWLASGRSDPDYDVGYLFLYFYGLERRVFVDNADEREREIIVVEVRRLLDIYGANRSVRTYLATFLETTKLLDLDPDALTPVFENPGYELPVSLRVSLGAMARSGEPLTADWLLSWYACHPDHRLRTPATRAFPEFRALFGLLFADEFPDGMKISASKRRLSVKYSAASGDFTVALDPKINGDSVPDVSGLRKPLTVAESIAGAATNALDRFSRYLGRSPDGRGSIEAHGLLPARLRPLFPCEKLEALRAWVRSRIDAGGLVPVEDLIERLEGARPDKLGKRMLTGAADALAGLGIGMAPDIRFALRRPKLGEPVFLFDLPDDAPDTVDAADPPEVSPAYAEALSHLAVGALVSHADGRIDVAEEAHLAARIEETPGLATVERQRLLANLKWMIAVPPDISALRARLREADGAAAAALGRMALLAAGADGVVHADEIRAIEKLYKSLGLDPGGLYSDLHALTAAADEPVVARAADIGQRDHAIPRPPSEGVSLDAARVAAIQANTAAVSKVLGNVFADDGPDDEEEEDITNGAAEETAEADLVAGLDAQHRSMAVALAARPAWTEEEFTDLADDCGLMPAGALETINEWAFERFGEALVEEYDGYEVAEHVAKAMRA